MWTIRSLLTLVFVGLSALSTATMALATRNYLEFFPAMDRVGARVASIEILPSNQDLIRVLFVLENPTGYSGLGVSSFQVTLTFQNPDGTVYRAYGDIKSNAQGSLPSHSELKIPGEASVPGEWRGTSELLAQGRVLALFHLTVALSSFLDSFSQVIVHLDCSVGQPPVDCKRAGVDAVPSSYGGGGGA